MYDILCKIWLYIIIDLYLNCISQQDQYNSLNIFVSTEFYME